MVCLEFFYCRRFRVRMLFYLFVVLVLGLFEQMISVFSWWLQLWENQLLCRYCYSLILVFIYFILFRVMGFRFRLKCVCSGVDIVLLQVSCLYIIWVSCRFQLSLYTVFQLSLQCSFTRFLYRWLSLVSLSVIFGKYRYVRFIALGAIFFLQLSRKIWVFFLSRLVFKVLFFYEGGNYCGLK